MKKCLSCLMMLMLIALPGLTNPSVNTVQKSFEDDVPVVIIPPYKVSTTQIIPTDDVPIVIIPPYKLTTVE